MSPSASQRSSVERKGLLRDSFDGIDDSEALENGRSNDNHERSNGRRNRSGEEWYKSRKIWSSASAWLRPRNLIMTLVIILLLAVVGTLWRISPEEADHHEVAQPTPSKKPQKPKPNPKQVFGGKGKHSELSPWKKPKGFKIIGLIFFGRQRTVEILDCYLKRNLVANGGFLDEVLWVANTNNEDDLKYLDTLVQTTKYYKNLTLIDLGYDSVWEHAVDDKNMFIKIDDDMVRFVLASIVFDSILMNSGILQRQRNRRHRLYESQTPRDPRRSCKPGEQPRDWLASLSCRSCTCISPGNGASERPKTSSTWSHCMASFSFASLGGRQHGFPSR